MGGKIILMRHGRTLSNARRYLDTRPPGAELTEMGRSQALAAGQRLREIAPELGLAVSSIALRAQQSLHLAMLGYGAQTSGELGVGVSAVPTAVLPGLHEIYCGDYEGHNSEEAHQHYNQALTGWKAGHLDVGLPGGETPRQLLDRYVPSLHKAYEQAAGKDLFVVSHGAAIRLIGLHGTTCDRSVINDRYIANGSLAVIEPTGDFGSWRCLHWADEVV
ncbi:MAG: histidine phosphatase family protein [Corynebacterium sp.]|uniref:histidine phosphatase family protein n=1 Tax=Corynebacterium sp. TaxID=1720 RepID=UPI0026DB8F1E|nr:histidine phosphatase family protein [Corynebacterium sp.]MDO5099383.1 histidine phosphatase family protein [Corynebacterium sp.]